jgi:Flp pilus assembly protein TadD
MKNRFAIFLFCFPVLLACQSNQSYQAQQKTPTKQLYLDQQFSSSTAIHIETEQEIFRLDDDMRAMVQAKLINNSSSQKKVRILLEHLFNNENIALAYETNANITATQAYHSKSANCMSLTIMAYALATEAGMNVSFQDVNVPEYWVRNGQYNLLTGHVNLLVKEKEDSNTRVVWGKQATLIDFDPFVAKKKFPSHVIKKNTLLAMFYNNKGADALVDNNYPLAYQYIKKATQVDNQFASAWGNLGVLYKLSGHYLTAEKAYRHAIYLKNDNLTSLGNLALLLNKQGRLSEAEPIEQHIHKLRIKNPYYHALLGNEAFFNNNYQQAVKHYAKAIKLDDGQHEFYLGLAKTYYMQNKLAQAKRVLSKAVTLTKVKDTQRQYIAKLNFLKHQETKHH